MRRRYKTRATNIAPKDRIERFCLKCNKPFTGDGKFNRVCPVCTKDNRYIMDQYMEIALVDYRYKI